MIFTNAILAIPALQGAEQWVLQQTGNAAPTLTKSPVQVVSGLLTPDQFAGYAVTAVWTIINLLIAYVVLKHFVFKPIIRLLNKRREAVLNELEDAANKQHLRRHFSRMLPKESKIPRTKHLSLCPMQGYRQKNRPGRS